MYLEFWGLRKQPFENTTDTSFMYSSRKHKEALTRMYYAVQQKKMAILIIGEYGTGKTYLSKALRKFFSEENVRFMYFTNPRITPEELVQAIRHELSGDKELPDDVSKPEILRSIHEKLEEYHSNGIYPVMVVDEAQSIQDENLLEEIRLLLNIQGEEYNLFTLILLGQPATVEKMAEVPQLKQRLFLTYKLPALSEEEMKNYIDHRLSIAGCTRKIFTDAAYSGVYTLSNGVPRAINTVCDLALLAGFVENVEQIDAGIIVKAREDLDHLEELRRT